MPNRCPRAVRDNRPYQADSYRRSALERFLIFIFIFISNPNKSPRLNAPALPIVDFYKLVGAVIPKSPKPCAEET